MARYAVSYEEVPLDVLADELSKMDFSDGQSVTFSLESDEPLFGTETVEGGFEWQQPTEPELIIVDEASMPRPTLKRSRALAFLHVVNPDGATSKEVAEYANSKGFEGYEHHRVSAHLHGLREDGFVQSERMEGTSAYNYSLTTKGRHVIRALRSQNDAYDRIAGGKPASDLYAPGEVADAALAD